jgi:cytochrome bd-type quinol oxidase subunit 2
MMYTIYMIVIRILYPILILSNILSIFLSSNTNMGKFLNILASIFIIFLWIYIEYDYKKIKQKSLNNKPSL